MREYIERAHENDPGTPMIIVEIYNTGYKPPGILSDYFRESNQSFNKYCRF